MKVPLWVHQGQLSIRKWFPVISEPSEDNTLKKDDMRELDTRQCDEMKWNASRSQSVETTTQPRRTDVCVVANRFYFEPGMKWWGCNCMMKIRNVDPLWKIEFRSVKFHDTLIGCLDGKKWRQMWAWLPVDVITAVIPRRACPNNFASSVHLAVGFRNNWWRRSRCLDPSRLQTNSQHLDFNQLNIYY